MTQLELQSNKTKKFSLNGLFFNAKCVKCYDGDTVHLVFWYNSDYYKFTCRLYNIDTPEIRSNNKKEREIAILVRNYLTTQIYNKVITIQCKQFDKYGRLLVVLYYNNLIGNKWTDSINYSLIEKGYAYKYAGGRRIKFEDWYKNYSSSSSGW